MNPKLIKFAVELQNHEKKVEEKKTIYLGRKQFFNFLKEALVTVPIEIHK